MASIKLANTAVTTTQTLYTTQDTDINNPERVLIQNNGAGDLYVNFVPGTTPSAATTNHLKLTSGSSVELRFTIKSTITGVSSATSQVVVVSQF